MQPEPRDVSGPLRLFARLGRSTVQTIANATSTAVVFDTIFSNFGGMWQANLGSRVVVPVRGIYTLMGGTSWVPNAGGIRFMWFRKNGDDAQAFGPQVAQAGSAVINDLAGSSEIFLNPGEFVELIVNQSSGGNLNLNAVLKFYPLFIVALKQQL